MALDVDFSKNHQLNILTLLKHSNPDNLYLSRLGEWDLEITTPPKSISGSYNTEITIRPAAHIRYLTGTAVIRYNRVRLTNEAIAYVSDLNNFTDDEVKASLAQRYVMNAKNITLGIRNPGTGFVLMTVSYDWSNHYLIRAMGNVTIRAIGT